MVVTTEDNRLFAQLAGQPKVEIYPSGPSKFFWKETRITRSSYA